MLSAPGFVMAQVNSILFVFHPPECKIFRPLEIQSGNTTGKIIYECIGKFAVWEFAVCGFAVWEFAVCHTFHQRLQRASRGCLSQGSV